MPILTENRRKWPKIDHFRPFSTIFGPHIKNALGAILCRPAVKKCKNVKMHFSPLRHSMILVKNVKNGGFGLPEMASGGRGECTPHTPPAPPLPERVLSHFGAIHAKMPRGLVQQVKPWSAMAGHGWLVRGGGNTPHMCMTRATVGACVPYTTRVRYPCTIPAPCTTTRWHLRRD